MRKKKRGRLESALVGWRGDWGGRWREWEQEQYDMGGALAKSALLVSRQLVHMSG